MAGTLLVLMRERGQALPTQSISMLVASGGRNLHRPLGTPAPCLLCACGRCERAGAPVSKERACCLWQQQLLLQSCTRHCLWNPPPLLLLLPALLLLLLLPLPLLLPLSLSLLLLLTILH